MLDIVTSLRLLYRIVSYEIDLFTELQYVLLRAESGDTTWPPAVVGHASLTASKEEVTDRPHASATYSMHSVIM